MRLWQCCARGEGALSSNGELTFTEHRLNECVPKTILEPEHIVNAIPNGYLEILKCSPFYALRPSNNSLSFSTPHDNAAAAPRPEIQLLLCCGSLPIEPEKAARISQLLGQQIDWQYAIEKARRHGLLPLFYRTLKEVAPAECVPETHLRSLREHARLNAARNVVLLAELKKILREFAAHDIHAMPYKGPALAVAVYGDLSLRQFTDLDILIRKRDVWRATRLLVGQGYRPYFDVPEARQDDFLRLGYVQLFERDEGRESIELHWAFAPRFFGFQLETEAFWEKLEQLDLGGTTVLAPPAEELLLILCAHGAKDMWERLEWICSVAELVRSRPQIDWQRSLKIAAEANVERVLLLGLLLARDLFGARLPAFVERKIAAAPSIKKLAGQIRARLFSDDAEPPGVFERIRFHLQTRERVRDRVRYCLLLATTPTPGDWASLQLPASRSFLYAFARPVRLLKKYRKSPGEK